MSSVEDDPRLRFGIRFSMLARRWRQQIDTALNKAGMTDATWMPLVHLNETGGGITQKELAARLGIDASSLVRLLDILERKSLIVRRPDEIDGRARRLYLTDAGEARMSEIRALLWQTENEMLAGIDEDQAAAMLAGMERIESSLNALNEESA